MNLRQQSSTSYPTTFFMVDSSDHVTGKTGLTPTVTISKNGAGFGAAAGAVSEVGNGWYALAGNATDRGTVGDLLIHATGVGADPADERYVIVPWDPFESVLSVNVAQISMDQVAADNLETMLDGTGGKVLSLKQIDIVNNDVAPGGQGIDITARTGIRIIGSDQGISATGGTNQALYLASSTGAATIYVEGPSDGTGSAIAISSPGATPAGTSASGEAVWIETSDAHPALRVDFGAAGGDVFDVVDSDNGDWVWDDKVFAALTAQGVRDALKLAPTAGSPAAGSVDAHLDSLIAYGVGTGTGTYTDTVTDGVDPIDNVLVQLSTDAAGTNMVYRAYTAADGVFTMYPDPGTYYVWLELAGYSFTQGAEVTVT